MINVTLINLDTGMFSPMNFVTRVQERDSVIFEKVGCECGETRWLKIYLFIFSIIFIIKIFLKTHYYALIHKTKKEEGKKHITMPMRWEFRLFRLDSRPILAVPTRFKADFSRFGPFLLFWSPTDTARFWPNQPDSTRIGVNRSRVNTNPRKKKKKKSSDTAPTHGQPSRTLRPMLSRVKLGCGTLPATSVLSRFSLS